MPLIVRSADSDCGVLGRCEVPGGVVYVSIRYRVESIEG